MFTWAESHVASKAVFGPFDLYHMTSAARDNDTHVHFLFTCCFYHVHSSCAASRLVASTAQEAAPPTEVTVYVAMTRALPE